MTILGTGEAFEQFQSFMRWVQERVAQSLSNCQLESISMMLK